MRAGSDAATAGLMVVASMILVAGVAYAVGSLVKAAVPLGIVGLFAGLFIGLGLVYARFRAL